MTDEDSENDFNQKEFDRFNDHQKDNRSRATQLVNYAFLLAGGTFTASVTVFTSRPKDQITSTIVSYLYNGWYNLFLSIVAFFGLIFVMIIRDYFTAEVIWRPTLYGGTSYISNKYFTVVFWAFEFVIVVSGIFGFCTLAYGLQQIMEAACALIA